MSLSPMSPRSPMILRKTLASVPPPLTLPVQMVTRYFITVKGNREEDPLIMCLHMTTLCKSQFQNMHLGFIEQHEHFLQGSGSSMMAPVAGSSLMISLSSSFTSSQRPHWNEYFSIVRVFSKVTCGKSQPQVTGTSSLPSPAHYPGYTEYRHTGLNGLSWGLSI